MDLSKLLSVSGKNGLFKMIAQSKNAVIVESLIDKKRFPAYASDKISILEDINIYTNEKEILLKEVFQKIYDKESGGLSINHKSDNETLKKYFEQVLPNYDRDRVFVSDIKKLINWYNILQKLDMIKPDKKEEKKQANDLIEDAEIVEEDK
jgi:hypothetical protein